MASLRLPVGADKKLPKLSHRTSSLEVIQEEFEADAGREREKHIMQKLKKDRNNIATLLLLYILQGIPIGLAASVPMVLQAKMIGYRQQAMFSLVTWPFSIKLLWAPIVDSMYSRAFGRRKSWLVPVQYAIGIAMILISYTVDGLMGEGKLPPNVFLLTVFFIVLHFLAATQDIAVDGWALTMLSRENVGYASTCNSVGQTAGYFLGYTIFLALESKEFCNTYLRVEPQETGVMELSSFLFFWGLIFVTVTTAIWWFKSEKREEHAEEQKTILEAYFQLLTVLKLPSVKTLVFAVLTSKMAFAAADSVTGLKLIEAGLPKEKIALLALPMVPLQIILPWIISRATAGPRPMDIYLRAYVPRIAMSVVFAAVVWVTPYMGSNGEFPLYYYFIILAAFGLHQVAAYSMFVATMAFHARISDPAIGGTYMTLLNTVSNLAGTWPSTLALWLVDNVSFKDCEGVKDYSLDCDTMQELQACEEAGGHCVTHLDGYYIEIMAGIVIGLVWYFLQSQRIRRLQSLEDSAWKCS
jgi:PAT family acetyl-CoA transporter-like MFS transporter 1